MAWVKHDSQKFALRLSRAENERRLRTRDEQLEKRRVNLTTTQATLKAAFLEEEIIDAEFAEKRMLKDSLVGKLVKTNPKDSLLNLARKAITKKFAFVMHYAKNIEEGFDLKGNEREKYIKYSNDLMYQDTRELMLKRGIDFKINSMKMAHSVPDFVKMTIED